MIPQAEAFYNRVANAVDRSASLGYLSEWMCKHTYLDGNPFSFKNHEYQPHIVDDPHSRKNIKKCSQVGLSELSVRITLAFLGVSRSKRAIYTLPTSRFASKFSKDRFDPVIEESPFLSNSRIKSADSAEMKRLGSSTLYLNGTFGQSSAISIPAHLLVHDEIDFSDDSVVATYQSRLRHAEEDEYGFKGITYRFSTPTVKGFGISDHFDRSTQNYYFVKCSKCNHRGAPDFFRDVVLPGYDGDMAKFSKSDAENPYYNLSEAYLACPKCGHNLEQDLKDPTRREWVSLNPSAREAGWQVSPFDVPHYNSIPSLLLQASTYKRIGDWHNFTLGLEYEDADNTFLSDPFTKGHATTWTPPSVGAYGTFAGVDVGKITHLVIGKEVDGRPHIIFAEKIKMDQGLESNLNLAMKINERMEQFGVLKLVIDAMPDYSTALALVGLGFPGQVYANYYQQSPPKNKLTNLVIKEEESVVSSYKTGVLDDFCKLHNGFGIAYAQHPEIIGDGERGSVATKNSVLGQMRNLKKIVNAEAATSEEAKGVWIKTGPDHYGHAMNYAMIAMELMELSISTSVVGSVPCVSTVRVGGNIEKT